MEIDNLVSLFLHDLFLWNSNAYDYGNRQLGLFVFMENANLVSLFLWKTPTSLFIYGKRQLSRLFFIYFEDLPIIEYEYLVISKIIMEIACGP